MTAPNEPKTAQADRTENWRERLKEYQQRLDDNPTEILPIEGRLTRMVGLTLEAVGFQAPVGSRCEVHGISGPPIEAEVVGFSGETLFT